MLTAESRFSIQDLYLRRIPISETACPTGHDREAIRLIVPGALCPPPAECHVRRNSLGRFVPYLDKRIAEVVSSRSRFLMELRQRGYARGRGPITTFVWPCGTAQRPEPIVRSVRMWWTVITSVLDCPLADSQAAESPTV